MFDVTFPLGQAETEALSTGVGATDSLDPWDDSVLSAEPDGDVFGCEDEDDEDDDVDDDDTDLADEFDDEDD